MFLIVKTNAQSCGTHLDETSRAYLEATKEARMRYTFNPPANRAPLLIRIQPHVITRFDFSGGISQESLDRELRQLNAFFAPMDVRFEMCESNLIRRDEFFDFDRSSEGELVQNNKPNVINIYFASTITSGETEICGYTYFPGRINNAVFMANACASNGTTLAHELGHYFSLYHTHGKTNTGTTDELVSRTNCEIAGDDLCDTPADPNLSGKVNGSCTYIGTDRDANNQEFTPDVRNIMSYSIDRCMNFLSPQQYARMRFTLENHWQELLEESPECEVFSIDDCSLTVSNTDISGFGSFAYAIRCANLRAGADTITFELPENARINLIDGLPRIIDDSTFIDGTLSGGGQITLNAQKIGIGAGDVNVIRIDAKNVQVKGIRFEHFLRQEINGLASVSVIQVEDGAENFLIEGNTFDQTLVAMRIGRAFGLIQDNIINRNAMGIRFLQLAKGVNVRRNSISCNSEGALEFESETTLRLIPDAPSIMEANKAQVSGKSEANASIDLFQQNIIDCSFGSCQGVYIGSTTADASGNWTIKAPIELLGNYTATATLNKGGNLLTSELAECRQALADQKIWIYPNPSDGEFTLEMNAWTNTPFEIEVFDLMGRKIQVLSLDKRNKYKKETIDLKHLGPGHYILRTEIEEEASTQRIVIQ